MQEFSGKVAVITGGASGIGKALARACLGEGAKVVIADVERPALDAAVAELGVGGGDVHGVVVDVRDFDSVASLADRVFERHGACHLLFNNAGVGVPDMNLWETEPTDWQWVLGVNVQGVVHGIQAFVPRMIASGEAGVVVNTSSSNGGIGPLPGQPVYAASKAAVSTLTECLAAQLRTAGTKLRAVLFYPSGGLLDTNIYTTARNRPADLARNAEHPPGSQPSFEEMAEILKEQMGFELPVQDLDELAAATLEGIRGGEFVVMLHRELMMEPALTERTKKLVSGACPI